MKEESQCGNTVRLRKTLRMREEDRISRALSEFGEDEDEEVQRELDSFGSIDDGLGEEREMVLQPQEKEIGNSEIKIKGKERQWEKTSRSRYWHRGNREAAAENSVDSYRWCGLIAQPCLLYKNESKSYV